MIIWKKKKDTNQEGGVNKHTFIHYKNNLTNNMCGNVKMQCTYTRNHTDTHITSEHYKCTFINVLEKIHQRCTL
jgi:hypothetical protein